MGTLHCSYNMPCLLVYSLHRPLNSPVANAIDSAASYYNSPPGPDQPPLLSPSSVSSSFVNVFTGSFIIPLRDITLSTKLGEGMVKLLSAERMLHHVMFY